MDDSVLYYRGPFPPNAAKPPDDVVDAFREIVKLDEPTFESLLPNLADAAPFLSLDDVRRKLGASIDGSPGASLAKSLSWLSKSRDRLSDEKLLSALGNLALSSDPNVNAFDEAALNVLRRRFKQIDEASAGYRLSLKAQKLAVSTGRRFRDVATYCDIRPVFDEARQTIVGAVVTTTLRLTAEDFDGLPVGLEVSLSEKDVEELLEHVKSAHSKAAKLRDLCAKHGITVPQTPSKPQSGA